MNRSASLILIGLFFGLIVGFATCKLFFASTPISIPAAIINPHQKWQDSVNKIIRANADTIRMLKADILKSKDRVKTNHLKIKHENKQIDHFTFSSRQLWHDSTMRANRLR
jgi:hypothetical protein